MSLDTPLCVEDLTMLRRFVPGAQLNLLLQFTGGEEKQHFLTLLAELAARIKAMPMTRGTESVDDPIVHLHYFRGNVDVWITERDIGDGRCPKGLGPQHQAFGYVDLGYGPELGYVSLPEIFSTRVELDLNWTPKPVSQVLREHEQAQAVEA